MTVLFLVVSQNSITNGPGISFNSDEQITVDQGIITGSTGVPSTDNGINSLLGLSILDNSGIVFSSHRIGVDFDVGSSSGLIQNFTSGTISGFEDGIVVNGDGETINNSGDVFGTGLNIGLGIQFGLFSRNVQVSNDGTVTGAKSGVLLASLFDGGIVDNLGSIIGLTYGIDIQDTSGFVSQVTNEKGATVTGGPDAIIEKHGDLALLNAGTLNGNLFLDYLGSTDTLTNNGKITGTVTLDGAFETFKGKKGVSGDIVTGPGNDTVQLGKGHVSIHIFEPATSHLTAGAGHDKFIFDDGFGGLARIKHFSASVDKIELSEKFFPGLGPHGNLQLSHFGINHDIHNTNLQIVYNDHTGLLYYDANGDLPGGLTPFAKLVGEPPISNFAILLEA